MRLRSVATAAFAFIIITAPLAVSATNAGSTGGSPASTTSTTTTTTTTTPTATTTTTITTTTTRITTPPKRNRDNPFSNPALASYLAHRTNLVTAAVYDVKSGDTFTYHNGVRERTASMVKIDILADLLYESQQDHRPLSEKQESLATTMIEDSDNTSADKLWAAIGGRDALDAFNEMIGFKNTLPSYTWGAIETTPLDQLQLLKVISLPNAHLDAASRAYEMDLMEDVIGSERFGLGWGSPGKATVGLKDGWYPETDTGWQVNTSGYVQYRGRFYLVTIMDTDNPNEQYGIATVSTIASDIWKYLKP